MRGNLAVLGVLEHRAKDVMNSAITRSDSFKKKMTEMSQEVHVNARRYQDMKENARRCLKKMVGDLEATGGFVSKRVSRRGKDPKVEKDLNIPWEWKVFSSIIIRERVTLCSSGM